VVVMAVAFKNGLIASTVEKCVYHAARCKAPTINQLPGGNVTMSCASKNATIHFTLDGTTPTASSQTYSSDDGVRLDTSTTEKQVILAFATHETLVDSSVEELEIVFNQVARPIITSPADSATSSHASTPTKTKAAYDGNLIVGTQKLALFRAVNKLGDDNILDLEELENALNDADQELVHFVAELGIDMKMTEDTSDSARRLFECLDKNGSGDVTMNEFMQGLQKLAQGKIEVAPPDNGAKAVDNEGSSEYVYASPETGAVDYSSDLSEQFEISCATEGAIVTYTKEFVEEAYADGGDDDAFDTYQDGDAGSYGGAFKLDRAVAGYWLIQAKATKDEMVPSIVVKRKIQVLQVPLPEVTRTSDSVNIDLTELVDEDTFGSVSLCYTVDGTTPSPGKPGTSLYNPLARPKLDLTSVNTTTFKVIATSEFHQDSNIVECTIGVQQALPPHITFHSGAITIATDDGAQTTDEWDDDEEARTVYYTLDESAPNAASSSSKRYFAGSKPTVDFMSLNRLVIKAITVVDGMVPSNESMLDVPRADAPSGQLDFKQLRTVFKHETKTEHYDAAAQLTALFEKAHDASLGASTTTTTTTTSTTTTTAAVHTAQLRSVKKHRRSMVKNTRDSRKASKAPASTQMTIQDKIRATKQEKAFAELPSWCRRIDADSLTQILQSAGVMNHADTNKKGVIDVAKVMGKMELDASNDIDIEEFLNALLAPHRSHGLHGTAGDVVLHATMTTHSPDTEIIYTVMTPEEPDERRPTLQNKRVWESGGVLSQTPIDGGGQQIRVNAIAIGACLPSDMSTVEVTVPTLNNPAISIRPISGTTMQLKLTSVNPSAEMFYSMDNQFPSRSSSEYPGKMVKMGIPKRAGQLRVRARAYLGDLCSGVSELSFDLEGFGLASIERQGEHRFQLQSAGLWISMGDSVKIDSVHQELHDEEMIKAGMAKAGAELPQTQEWLRRQGETLRDDGWSTSPDNPVYRARQQHILETTGANNMQEFATAIATVAEEVEPPPSPAPVRTLTFPQSGSSGDAGGNSDPFAVAAAPRSGLGSDADSGDLDFADVGSVLQTSAAVVNPAFANAHEVDSDDEIDC